MGRTNFFKGAVGRTLQVTLLRFQPVCQIQEFRAPITSVANASLLFKSPEDKLFRDCNFIARHSSSKNNLLSPSILLAINKCLKHTDSPSTKETEIRNFASSVIEPKPILNEDAKLRQQNSEEWKEIQPNYSIKPYLSLAKIKLTSFVMMTSMAGYAAAPCTFDLATFASCSIGVLLTSSAANTINQIFEVPYDSQMSRTMNRPLVKGLVTPIQAMGFAGFSSSLGVLTLLCGANPLAAFLGFLNILIYTLMYTPMKRTNIANTWVGSIVGALPPMIGWVAATGHLDAGAWLLGGVLFAWQFPHFCALSWNLQSDYSRAGYRMMSVVNPDLCKKVALRYSLALTGLSFLFPICDVTSWPVAFCSLPINAYFNYLSWQFYSNGDSSSARKLFKFSLVYLPLVLVLMIASNIMLSCMLLYHYSNIQNLLRSLHEESRITQ